MELTQQDIELIDRFKNGELSELELASFHEKMKNADFASAVSLYDRAIDVIRDGGRSELRNTFASIQSKLESGKGFEKYKPGKPKGGGSLWSWVIMGIIIATASYLYFTGKIKPEQIKELLRENGADTVYHYIYHTDTVVRYHTDTIVRYHTDTITNLQDDTVLQGESKAQQQGQVRKIIRIDTVYQSVKK